MMTGTVDKNGRTFYWPAVPFAVKVPEEDITKYCHELCKNIALLCTGNSQFDTKYIIHPNLCVNELDSASGEIIVPPMDHFVTDLGVVDVIKERFYESDNKLMELKGMTFATSFSDRPHKYFSPLDGVYSTKAQQFGFINHDEIESEEEDNEEVDGGNGNGGGDDGAVMMDVDAVWSVRQPASIGRKCGLASVPKDGACLEDLVRALLGKEK